MIASGQLCAIISDTGIVTTLVFIENLIVSLLSLQFFLSMEETTFWLAMDRCPDCTSYILFAAYNQCLKRKASQLANMANQESDAGIDLLFQLS
uniref:Uncharacterized protein n=1 Tax=Glyptapanteles flavicoxis TaxID=463051 RepID=B7S8H5_9HYME|nr:hypothetical protein GFP_L4_0180 [Glyptapanteles flavicoxis]